METLKEQLLINQFVTVAGCPPEQAKNLLQLHNWQFQTALSIFFQEAAASQSQYHQNPRFNPICTPANTPATPPNFPETLLAFSKLSTSESSHSKGCNNRTGGFETHALNHSYHYQPQYASPSTSTK